MIDQTDQYFLFATQDVEYLAVYIYNPILFNTCSVLGFVLFQSIPLHSAVYFLGKSFLKFIFLPPKLLDVTVSLFSIVILSAVV